MVYTKLQIIEYIALRRLLFVYWISRCCLLPCADPKHNRLFQCSLYLNCLSNSVHFHLQLNAEVCIQTFSVDQLADRSIRNYWIWIPNLELRSLLLPRERRHLRCFDRNFNYNLVFCRSLPSCCALHVAQNHVLNTDLTNSSKDYSLVLPCDACTNLRSRC